MKTFKVLGSGCRSCELTANVIVQAAKEADVEIGLEKVTDIAEILGYGVIATPDAALGRQGCARGRDPRTGPGAGMTQYLRFLTLLLLVLAGPSPLIVRAEDSRQQITLPPPPDAGAHAREHA
jgi:hypothetical protein